MLYTAVEIAEKAAKDNRNAARFWRAAGDEDQAEALEKRAQECEKEAAERRRAAEAKSPLPPAATGFSRRKRGLKAVRGKQEASGL